LNGGGASLFAGLEENSMHGDQMADPDALWARDGSQDQVIKSDLDNFSAKKSAKDQNEEKENHDLEM
jgi:hypothetical protein